MIDGYYDDTQIFYGVNEFGRAVVSWHESYSRKPTELNVPEPTFVVQPPPSGGVNNQIYDISDCVTFSTDMKSANPYSGGMLITFKLSPDMEGDTWEFLTNNERTYNNLSFGAGGICRYH